MNVASSGRDAYYEEMKFHEKVSMLIGRMGISQSELSRRSGIDRSMISDALNGKHALRLGNALKVARALGVSLEYLADEGMSEPPPPAIGADELALIRLARLMGMDEAMRRLVQAPPSGDGGKELRGVLPERERGNRDEPFKSVAIRDLAADLAGGPRSLPDGDDEVLPAVRPPGRKPKR